MSALEKTHGKHLLHFTTGKFELMALQHYANAVYSLVHIALVLSFYVFTIQAIILITHITLHQIKIFPYVGILWQRPHNNLR